MKQTTNSLKKLLLVLPFVFLMVACSEDEKMRPTAPQLSTATVTDISFTSSVSGGTITSDGGSAITERGITWATTPNPTTENKTVDGTGKGAFVSELSDLLPNTLYYVRAYASNKVGISYGEELTFSTNELGVPILTMGAIQNIGYVSASVTANVTGNVGSGISKVGVCWSTSPNPSVDDFKNELDNSTEISGELFKNLDLNTTYYVRSYAINMIGIAYGPEVSFTTLDAPPLGTVSDIDGNVYGIVEVNGKRWMKENLKVTKYANGDAIPTTANNVNVALETSPKYQWIYNDDNVNLTYGRLYTWFVATDDRKVCPIGWHVPTKNELETLGASAYSLREEGAVSWSNANGTNNTEFSAKGAGLRGESTFFQLNDYWIPQATDSDGSNVLTKTISVHYNDNVVSMSQSKKYGLSVRCTLDQ